MARHDFAVRYHNFVPIKKIGNVVLARCDCCSKPRYAVFIIKRDNREFKYHGYDLQYAENLFNFLVSKSQVK